MARDPLEVVRDAAHDLHRWAKGWSYTLSGGGDMEGTAQDLDDAAKALAETAATLELARARIARLETAILDYLDKPRTTRALDRLGWALEQDWDEAVKLG